MQKRKKVKIWIGILLGIVCIAIVTIIRMDSKKEKTTNVVEEINIAESSIEEESDKEENEVSEEDILASSVCIIGDNMYGSGSIYNMDEESIYIVSSAHLTIYILNPVVHFFDGTIAKGTSIKNAEQLDMGIVEVKKDDISVETLAKLKEITISQNEKIKDVRMLVYTAEGMEAEVVNGFEYHPEFHSHMVRCFGVVEPGSSGMGVFDSEQNYLGMISGAKEDEFVFLPVELMMEEACFGGDLYDEN
jgi:hypothetical protein